MIAFSTCWNSGRHTSGDEMLREIQTLGFNLIELGHGIRISLMPGIQKMFDAGEVRFSSLHNFCPLPVEVMSASPDCYEFSAAGKSERDRAVKQTLQTLDFAERLNAPFVVLHCGSISMNPITDELIALAQNGALLSRKYVRKKSTRCERANAPPPHIWRGSRSASSQSSNGQLRKMFGLGSKGVVDMKKFRRSGKSRNYLMKSRRRTSDTGTIWVISKSRKILAFLTMSNGLAGSLRARSVATCRM